MRLKQKRSYSAGVNKGSRREIVKRKGTREAQSLLPLMAIRFVNDIKLDNVLIECYFE